MPHHAKTSQKKKKNVRSQNLGPKLAWIASFPQKENVLVNLNVAFICLLHPIMLVNILQISIEWRMRYEVAKIWGSLIQITHLSHKEFFLGKMTDCYFLLTFCVLSWFLTFQKDNWVDMIMKTAKIWANSVLNYSFSLKGGFSQKIDHYHLYLSSKPHHPTTFQTNP